MNTQRHELLGYDDLARYGLTRRGIDRLVFDPARVTATTIRDEDEYAVARVKLAATLSIAPLTVGIDVNFGDPITAKPGAQHVDASEVYSRFTQDQQPTSEVILID